MAKKNKCHLRWRLFFYFLNSGPRADALHCLLAQAVHSLMAQEKQMPPAVALVFLYLRLTNPALARFLPADAGGSLR